MVACGEVSLCFAPGMGCGEEPVQGLAWHSGSGSTANTAGSNSEKLSDVSHFLFDSC